MLQEPRREEFSSYAEYGLAALGYAVFLHGAVGVAGVECRSGGSGCCAAVGTVALGRLLEGHVPGVGSGSGLAVGGDGAGECGGGTGSSPSVAVGPCGVSCVGGGNARDTVSCAGGAPVAPGGVAAAGLKAPVWSSSKVRREKKKARKRRKQAAAAAAAAAGSAPVCVEEKPVPVAAVVPKQEVPWRSARVGYFSTLDAGVQAELRETRARVLIARNNRELADEKARLAHLNSPMAAVEEAMRVVAIAERLAKRDNDNRVLGWAKTVAEDYASSISGTARSVPTVSVSASSSVSQAEARAAEKFGLRVMPANGPEAVLVTHGVVSVAELVSARQKLGRRLEEAQLLGKKPLFPLTKQLQASVGWAAAQDARASLWA